MYTCGEGISVVLETADGLSVLAMGCIWLGYQLIGLFAFIHLHLIHRISLDRYRGSAGLGIIWALMIGASDSVGPGFVEMLVTAASTSCCTVRTRRSSVVFDRSFSSNGLIARFA